MNRSDLQNLARMRLREAKVLFDNHRYEGAYYLLGYAVECALKAYIAKQTRRYDFPPDRKFVNEIYTHDLNKLLSVSGLESEYRKETNRNPNFELNWTIVKDWSEQARYASGVSRAKSKDFRSAVVRRKTGIFPRLQKHW
ncbi:MAG TPA: HEPN domain-containing protein [Pyrinomonadaceae bacterium]|jgi:HEPN domain-containing protein|nr:HEPN domain-containing protein [Pyrinomonadaceae bacterium]